MIRVNQVVAEALGEDTRFVIVELAAGGLKPVYDEDGQLLKFEDGKAAARKAQALSGLGGKFQVRPVTNSDWRSREAQRLAGKYTLLPWHDERWWQGLKSVWADHYPHVSIIKDAMLAFTESEDKGAADIQTRIKPGRYLERHFGPVLNAHVIRDLCAQFSAKFEDNMLLFADDEDSIEEIYLTGPGSCMSKSLENYESDIHPVRVYAAGDLQVAYLRRDGRVVARTVVWPDKKTFGPIYGDANRLKPLLGKKGYKHSPPYGARLRKVKNLVKGEKNAHCFVIPHLDGVGWVRINGEHLTVGEGPNIMNDGIAGQSARGTTEALFSCSHCKDGAMPRRSMLNVYAGSSNNATTYKWCKQCANQEAFSCVATGCLVANDQGFEVNKVGGTKPALMWNRYRSKYAFQCEGTQEWWTKEHQARLKDGRTVSRAFATSIGAKRCACGVWVTMAAECDSACKDKLARVQQTSYTLGGTTTISGTTSFSGIYR